MLPQRVPERESTADVCCVGQESASPHHQHPRMEVPAEFERLFTKTIVQFKSLICQSIDDHVPTLHRILLEQYTLKRQQATDDATADCDANTFVEESQIPPPPAPQPAPLVDPPTTEESISEEEEEEEEEEEIEDSCGNPTFTSMFNDLAKWQKFLFTFRQHVIDVSLPDVWSSTFNALIEAHASNGVDEATGELLENMLAASTYDPNVYFQNEVYQNAVNLNYAPYEQANYVLQEYIEQEYANEAALLTEAQLEQLQATYQLQQLQQQQAPPPPTVDYVQLPNGEVVSNEEIYASFCANELLADSDMADLSQDIDELDCNCEDCLSEKIQKARVEGCSSLQQVFNRFHDDLMLWIDGQLYCAIDLAVNITKSVTIGVLEENSGGGGGSTQQRCSGNRPIYEHSTESDYTNQGFNRAGAFGADGEEAPKVPYQKKPKNYNNKGRKSKKSRR